MWQHMFSMSVMRTGCRRELEIPAVQLRYKPATVAVSVNPKAQIQLSVTI